MSTETTESRRTANEAALSECASPADAKRHRVRSGGKTESSVPAIAVPPNPPDAVHVLDPHQRKVMQVFVDLGQQRGYPPTSRDIAKTAGLANLFAVSYRLSTLQAMRCLSRDVGPPRTAAVRPHSQAVPVAVVGQIAAGRPILAEESIEDVFPLPRQLVGEGTLFLLKVVGDSMMGVAIADGDWVVVRQQPVVENGEIAAAMIDGEATIKTFKQSDDHVWLVPHNPAYAPMMGDDAIILGKVVVVLRRL
jgi:repressor LexA